MIDLGLQTPNPWRHSASLSREEANLSPAVQIHRVSIHRPLPPENLLSAAKTKKGKTYHHSSGFLYQLLHTYNTYLRGLREAEGDKTRVSNGFGVVADRPCASGRVERADHAETVLLRLQKRDTNGAAREGRPGC